RAAFWCLDRDGIKGQYGENRIAPKPDDEDESGEPPPPKGIGAVDVPPRWIYCLDLRDHSDHRIYVDEVKRIAEECRVRREQQDLNQWTKGTLTSVRWGRSLKPDEQPRRTFVSEELLKQPGRRWYPVIDYSRCTNCMECLDFCLFGVYGVDGLDRLTVENQ